MGFYRENFPEASILGKMHLLEVHTIPWLHQHGVGLGLMGEQGAESIHASINGIKAEKFKSTSAEMTQLYIGNLPSSADERFIKDLLCKTKTHSKKKDKRRITLLLLPATIPKMYLERMYCRPPLIVTKCSKSILECEECTAERVYTETMILHGLDDLLECIASILNDEI